MWVVSDDETGGVDGGVRESEGGDDAVAAAFGGTEMNEEDLIFTVFDDAGEFGAAADEVAGSELAFEDGVLEVVAETAHEFEDFAEAAVVGDVVADEVGLAHFGLPATAGGAGAASVEMQKDDDGAAQFGEGGAIKAPDAGT